MLRVFVISASVAIIMYGIILLIKLFSGASSKKRTKKFEEARSLADLEEKARQVSADKETILGEAQRNQDVLDNINNTLNQ
jgi:hypothetical protein